MRQDNFASYPVRTCRAPPCLAASCCNRSRKYRTRTSSSPLSSWSPTCHTVHQSFRCSACMVQEMLCWIKKVSHEIETTVLEGWCHACTAVVVPPHHRSSSSMSPAVLNALLVFSKSPWRSPIATTRSAAGSCKGGIGDAYMRMKLAVTLTPSPGHVFALDSVHCLRPICIGEQVDN